MTDVQNQPETQSQPTPKGKKGKDKEPVNVKKEIISWVLTLSAAVIIALVIRTFVFEPVRVDGSSMLDTLHDGEIMFVTKPEYLLGDPNRGDVIICHYPDRDPYFVKRIIAVPGDTIEIKGTDVYVNGALTDEDYLSSDRNRYSHTLAPLTLGPDEYFVMGDNRDNSNDSRAIGPITRDMIRGHVRFVLLPLDKIRRVE